MFLGVRWSAWFCLFFTLQTGCHSSRVSYSCHTCTPVIPTYTVSRRAFSVCGANTWNDLPPHVTAALSLAVFRQHLKIFLFYIPRHRNLTYTVSFTICRPCNNWHYLGHIKNFLMMTIHFVEFRSQQWEVVSLTSHDLWSTNWKLLCRQRSRKDRHCYDR